MSDNKVHGNRITVPLFEIASNPTISISSIKQRRFNLMNRDVVEPTVERIIDDLLIFRRREGERDLIRDYIIKHIKRYKTFDNLTTAVKEVNPEFEAMVERLGVLK